MNIVELWNKLQFFRIKLLIYKICYKNDLITKISWHKNKLMIIFVYENFKNKF